MSRTIANALQALTYLVLRHPWELVIFIVIYKEGEARAQKIKQFVQGLYQSVVEMRVELRPSCCTSCIMELDYYTNNAKVEELCTA